MFNANKIGLTSGQPKILYCLSKFKEADQKTIANYCEIEQATVGSILLGMENAGLIVRKQHEGNRRSLYVSLTDKGIEHGGIVFPEGAPNEYSSWRRVLWDENAITTYLDTIIK